MDPSREKNSRPKPPAPDIPPERDIAEFTVKAVLIGVFFGVLFGAANAYLGLKVGLTVSASIPAAVMAASIFRVLRSGTLLEANMVQTIGSAGESLAAGVIFTIPAMLLWGMSPSLMTLFLTALFGGWMGVLFMIPLRRHLIVQEHGKLPYPEGTACAEVLRAGTSERKSAATLFQGLGLGFVYEFLMTGLGLWQKSPKWTIPGLPKASMGMEVTPSLLGIGFILGPRIAGVMMAGGAMAWLVLIPLIGWVGSGLHEPLYPSDLPVIDMAPEMIWHAYIRYMGAGAVAVGGLISLARTLPTLLSSLRSPSSKTGHRGARSHIVRTDRDLPRRFVAGGLLAVFIGIGLLVPIPTGWIGVALLLLFGFFFVTVSSRIVGLIGSSSNPVSGMTLATLLFTAFLFRSMGWTDAGHQLSVLFIGAVVCIAAAVAGDISQDLKTGYLVGATPIRQQLGELIGVLTTSLCIGSVVLLLHRVYGIGSPDLPAPQATLMSLVIQGVLTAQLPWGFVGIGMVLALVVELLGVSSLPFAVGLYLPVSLTTPIFAGGILRRFTLGSERHVQNAHRKEKTGQGILASSGLIAGASLVGVFLALGESLREGFLEAIRIGSDWMGDWSTAGSLAVFLVPVLLIISSVLRFSASNEFDESSEKE